MSFEGQRDVIRQRLVAQWGAASDISWDGMGGKPYDRIEGQGFIRPRIEDGETRTQSIGGSSARFRHFASLVIEVFRPAGRGQETGLQWCDSLIAAFHRYQASGVHFWQRPFVVEAGADGNYFKWMVIAPFYDEFSA